MNSVVAVMLAENQCGSSPVLDLPRAPDTPELVNGSTIPASLCPLDGQRLEPTGCGTSNIGLHCWRKEVVTEGITVQRTPGSYVGQEG
ncbi:hypothetical protein L914_21437 [Phytophthora nicotianae]|uniref:Uncharacterized protein n=1 Tax=Phytophthora nicotianae TaxID=4792 RepID=W2M5N4_PHYNI|nr:hypothetical protein L914_21437 [Phytophthora nicotianae]